MDTRIPQRRRIRVAHGAGRIAVAGAAAIAMLVGAGVADAATPAATKVTTSQLKKVTLKIGNITGSNEIPWDLAGYKTPYKIEWSNFETAPSLVQALQAGAVNVAAPGITGVIDAQVNHLSVKAFAEWKNPGKALMILVPKSSTVTSVAQLKGKSIAVTKGSAMEGLLVEALKRVGLDESDVHVVDLPASAAATAFSGGQVDAWSISVPYSTAAEAQNGARVLVSGNFWPQVGFFVAKPTTLADPAYAAALGNFIGLYKKAVAKETAAGLASKYEATLQLPASVALVVAKSLIPGQVLSIGSAVEDNYKKTISDFAGAGLVSGKPSNPLSVFTTVFNRDLH